MIGNLTKAIDSDVLETIDGLREQASAALARFVALKEEIAHLEAIAELRKASGADLAPIKLVRGSAALTPTPLHARG